MSRLHLRVRKTGPCPSSPCWSRQGHLDHDPVLTKVVGRHEQVSKLIPPSSDTRFLQIVPLRGKSKTLDRCVLALSPTGGLSRSKIGCSPPVSFREMGRYSARPRIQFGVPTSSWDGLVPYQRVEAAQAGALTSLVIGVLTGGPIFPSACRPTTHELQGWLNRQFDDKIIEPNSALGGAIKYLLKYWDKLTLFLRQVGAPLDNNLCERHLHEPDSHLRTLPGQSSRLLDPVAAKCRARWCESREMETVELSPGRRKRN